MRKLIEGKCRVCGKKYVLKYRQYKQTCSVKCGLERMRQNAEFMRGKGRKLWKLVVWSRNL